MHLFGSTRDEWMAADLDGWLAPNRIYPGVAEAIKALMHRHEVYIVTTKQVGRAAARRQRGRCRGCAARVVLTHVGVLLRAAACGVDTPSSPSSSPLPPRPTHPRPPAQARFTEAILQQMAGIEFPMDRIFSQTVSGAPKSEVRGAGRGAAPSRPHCAAACAHAAALRLCRHRVTTSHYSMHPAAQTSLRQVLADLAQKHPEAASLHFVEDKMSTLEKVRLALNCCITMCCVVRMPVAQSIQHGEGVPACTAVAALAAEALAERRRRQSALRFIAGPPAPTECPLQVAKLDSLRPYNLYLVDWGYNTAEERARAAANQRIEVVGADRFAQLAGLRP